MILPDGWKEVKLGDIADIYSGGTPERNNRAFWNGNIPWIKTGLIQNHHITENMVDEWITLQGLEKSSARMVSKGSILMAMYGQGKTRGQVAIIDFSAAINQACAAFKLKSCVDTNFLYHSFKFKYDDIRLLSNTGGQKNLSISILKAIDILLPPLAEQKKIAEVLSAWDKAIELTEKLVAEKENLLAGIAVRFWGKNCSWQKHRLSDLLTERSEKSNGSESVFSVSVHEGVVNQIQHLGRSFSAKDTSHYNKVCNGDIVYTKSPTGDFPYGIVKQGHIKNDVIVSPLYGVYIPKSNAIGRLVEFFFDSPRRAANYLHPLIQKGAKNTINISNQTFLKGDIYIPENVSEQEKIASFLACAKKEITLLRSLATEYRKQKQWLMQKLLTGEMRVTV